MHALVTCLLLCVIPPADDNWPGFLGAGASAVDAETLPLTWSESENLAWKADLPGYGQSSPVVWNDRVYVTVTEGEMKEKYHVLALHLSDGTEIWRHTLDNSDPKENNLYVSRAAPTPAVDDNGVYVFFESGDMVALSHDNDVMWTRALSEDFGLYESQFGLGASLAQTDDAVILLADQEAQSYILGINKQSGEDIFKIDRESSAAWSSPMIVDVDGTPVLVVSSSGSIQGFNTSTGDLYFEYTGLGGNTSASPADFGNGRFLTGAAPNPQGNDDGLAAQSNCAFQLKKTGPGSISIEKLWTAEGATTSFGSPMIHGGMAYWVNRTGVVQCFDLETGERKYQQRIAEQVWATPLGVGDRVYFVGQRGSTTVLKTGPEAEVLAENVLYKAEQPQGQQGQFGGRTQYAVAAINGSLLIRTGDVLYCLRK